MKVLFAAIMVAALSVASNAFSQEEDTIGFMRDACMTLTNDKNNSDLEFGLCAGFIFGQRAWRDTACVLLEERDLDWFTQFTARNTQGHPLAAVAQGFINWANDDPEHWSRHLHVAIIAEDLWSEFPCENTN